MNFRKKIQTAFDPPSFLENYIAFFYDRCICARRYDGQIVSGFISAFFKVCLIWEPDPSLLHIFAVKMFLLTGEKMGHSPSFPSTCHCLRQFAHPADFIIPATLKIWRKKIVVKFPKDFWNNQEYLLPLSPMIWNLQILLFILGTLNQFDPLNHKIMIIFT